MSHGLNYSPHHGGGFHLDTLRTPTLAERIALTLQEQHAARVAPHARPEPSRPRQFSWEGEG